MKNIYYWTGFVDPKHQIKPEHHKVIEQLLLGNTFTAKLDLKKTSSSHRIYSAHINKEQRILFTTMPINQNPCLIILDVVLNHDYGKSWVFKNKTAVSSFISRYLNSVDPVVLEIEEIVIDDQELSTVTTPNLCEEMSHSRFLSIQNQTMLIWNDSQTAAIQADFPFAIIGSAGSGKTAIALQHLQAQCNDTSATLYYVSKSPGLVAEFKRIWDSSLDHKQDPSLLSRVHILSYEDLIRSIDNLHTKKTVDERYFITWFNEHLFGKRFKTLQRLRLTALYNEFQLLATVSTTLFTDVTTIYDQLGQRQSHIPAEARQELFMLYQHYLNMLSTTNSVDFSLYEIQNQQVLGIMIVDEAQDLSAVQLKQLIRLSRISPLSKAPYIGLFFDSNQALTQACIPIHVLRLIPKINIIELQEQFRTPKMIARLAELVLELKNKLSKGALNNTDYITYHAHANNSHPGRVEWVDDQAGLAYWQTQLISSPKIAIIVANEHIIEEAKAIFNTVLVFTPKMIKGLEYDTVVLYAFLSSHEFSLLNSVCSESMLAQTCSMHQPKDKESLQKIELFLLKLNELFVALTRCRAHLLVIDLPKTIEFGLSQPKPHHFSIRRYLQAQFLKISTNEVESTTCIIAPPQDQPVIEQAWREEANRLIETQDNQNIATAKLIYQQYLNNQDIYMAAETGDSNLVLTLLKENQQQNLLNQPRSSDGNTLLHLALIYQHR